MGGRAIWVILALAALFVVSAEGGRRRKANKEVANEGVAHPERKQKYLNVFQIISFPNDACYGSNSRNGTCYTAEECSSRSGTNGGSCANGFGVCCIFSRGCGSTSNENCTYFEETLSTPGTCKAKICPCGDNICRLRLDFDSFIIDGPSTETVSVTKILNGNEALSGVSVTNAGRCLSDTFSVTNPRGHAPSVICGTNTGQHMYVESSDCCNDLVFQLGEDSTSTRRWNIKVTQYSCDYKDLPPDGCTQYFSGDTVGEIQTYNFNDGNGRHLANQNQMWCFRRERGNCRICFSEAAATDFQLSGTVSANKNAVPTQCCQYGPLGTLSAGYDCLIIPNNVHETGDNYQRSRFCGRNGIRQGTKCTETTPFMVSFMSDMYEFGNAAATIAEAVDDQVGLRLYWWQDGDATCQE